MLCLTRIAVARLCTVAPNRVFAACRSRLCVAGAIDSVPPSFAWLPFSWQAQHFGHPRLHFSWQAQYFLRVDARIFRQTHWHGGIRRLPSAKTVAGVVFWPHAYFVAGAMNSTLSPSGIEFRTVRRAQTLPWSVVFLANRCGAAANGTPGRLTFFPSPHCKSHKNVFCRVVFSLPFFALRTVRRARKCSKTFCFPASLVPLCSFRAL